MSTTGSLVSPNPGESTTLHTPGAHQFTRADWVEVPEALVRRHCLSGAFFISKEAHALFEREGFPLDAVLCRFNRPLSSVRVGETLRMGRGLEAFFGFDEAGEGAHAFFVEISLRIDFRSH